MYEEIIALYPSEKLASLVQTALETDIVIPQQQYHHVTLNEYKEATDWKDKLRMLKEFPTPTLQDIDLLDEALQEDKAPLRRQAIVLIGMIEEKEILPYLYKGLRDKNPAVRRTAGDCLSDLGFKEALPEMENALNDPQKSHANDPAYEVKLQIEMAISRIENGDEALGSVWKQIANRNK